MTEMLRWSLMRAPLLPVAWILAHATVLLWKALDLNYLTAVTWITEYVLRPLHPLFVWLISSIAPALRTFVINSRPTEQDADKIFYGFLVPIYIGIIIGVLNFFRSLFFGRSESRRI